MVNTLLIAGIVCIIAAVVGGGVKLFGNELPALGSTRRQVLLAIVGLAFLIASYMVAHPKPPRRSRPQRAVAERQSTPPPSRRHQTRFRRPHQSTSLRPPSRRRLAARRRPPRPRFCPGMRAVERSGLPASELPPGLLPLSGGGQRVGLEEPFRPPLHDGGAVRRPEGRGHGQGLAAVRDRGLLRLEPARQALGGRCAVGRTAGGQATDACLRMAQNFL